MAKQLTMSVNDEAYQRLHADLEAAYTEMAADEQREREATEWADALTSDAIPEND